jgi:hypothetical protein
MRGLQWTLPSRGVVTALALLLFLMGSNYCLVSALAGSPMACLAPPGAASEPSSHCGHGGSQSGTPTASSCCVSLAPVSVPLVMKAETTATPVALAIEPDVAPVAERRDGEAPIPDESPPSTLHPPEPSLGRSPPLP